MPALIVAAVTFLLLWVLFILPQQRRIKAHREFVASLRIGDEVITTSGLFGTIVSVDGDEVGLEVADGVVLRFARGAMAARPGEEVAAAGAVAEPGVPRATAADRALDTVSAPTAADRTRPDAPADDAAEG